MSKPKMKHIAAAGFLLLGCAYIGSRIYITQQKVVTYSNEVRTLLGNNLVPLENVPYNKVIGYQPKIEEVDLGRLLFNDPILSRNNDTSCATCHASNHGYADGNSLSVGSLGRGGPNGKNVGKHFGEGVLADQRDCGDDGFGVECRHHMFRNTPSTMNAVYRADPNSDQGLLWDGRFGNLLFQVLLPIHTPEELCGTNPIVFRDKENLFRKGGPIFDTPVLVKHSHISDKRSGADLGRFHAQPELISEIPLYRETGIASFPTRNECTALAIAKIRKIPEYRSRFEKAYGPDGLSDLNIGRALASFISTHVTKNSPYDKFTRGDSSLSKRQLDGLVIFSSEVNKSIMVGSAKLKGAGCIECHSGPLQGGHSFETLGVVSDRRSALSTPQQVFAKSGFVSTTNNHRGLMAPCHVAGQTASNEGTYGPDIGFALTTGERSDCFKFRVPSLRNVIETYPYFHHGTARGQGKLSGTPLERSLEALKDVIEYHIRGPINPRIIASTQIGKTYFDPLFQHDPYVPRGFLHFYPGHEEIESVDLSEYEKEALLDFIAFGLWDRDAVRVGDLGNSLEHPTRVPSGFLPTMTRDDGNQLELPPNFD